MPLPEGVYEHLVTEALARELDELAPARALIEELDDRDHRDLAYRLGKEIERLLDALPAEDRLLHAQRLRADLLEWLAQRAGDSEHAAAVRQQQLAPPPRRLRAIYRGQEPPRPASPLSLSTLLTRNRHEPALAHELACEIGSADRIDALVAFVTMGGIRHLLPALEGFARRHGNDDTPRLRLLTTVFSGTTERAALDELARLPGVHVKVSYDVRRTRLHAKAWLFTRRSGLGTAYVGSANLTQPGLGAGHEWTFKATQADLPEVIAKFAGTFETLWADPEFEAYLPDDEQSRARLTEALATETRGQSQRLTLLALRPFPFQEQILDRLAAERAVHGRKRNLVVAATGTGKTVIAAFDYARQAAARGVTPRLLFLAHRRELLEQARDTFRHVLVDASFGELWLAGAEPRSFEHVFATIQTASRLLERLPADHFTHVIVDECHHLPAASYQTLLARLSPELLVGLTATPERTDGKSLLPDFDGHIACELRLWDALEGQLLVPFEYYGISDQVDLRRARWSRTGYEVAGLEGLYTGNQARATLVRAQLARRVADLRRVRALGFCVSVEHARYMAQQFSDAGVPALALSGEAGDQERGDARRKLEAREVNVVFTCDLYNEGVDLPFVDTLLLLRPTTSATLFLQQLGRGLRLAPGKTSCLVLDFIGQHREEFRFDATLAALSGVARSRLRRAVEEGFPFLPSGCVLQLDAVAKEQVLASLRSSLAGAAQLVEELRELSRDGTPRLARFLRDSGRELAEVYERAGGWSALRARAGLLPPDADRDRRSERLGRLLHIDEASRLTAYAQALARDPSGPLGDYERRRLLMLEVQLHPRGALRAAEQTLEYLTQTPGLCAELAELTEALADRVALDRERYPVAEWPLALHRHYTRHEILAAVGRTQAGKSAALPQGGVFEVDDKRELLFVTLDKTGRSFSPTTRFRDYAISPQRFHWETQASVRSERTGRRYLESPGNGWRFLLFVRVDPEAPFAFLGPVTYVEHTGDRPIAITWQLATPMPAALYTRFATLRPD